MEQTHGYKDVNPIPTYFAPAERAELPRVLSLSRFVQENPLFQAIAQSIDGYLMILNPERQVLAVNQNLLDILNVPSAESLIGCRPGEAIACVHSSEEPGGCGTSRACATCGAVIAILLSQREGRPATGECLATVRRGQAIESMEFRVRATPIQIGSEAFTVLVFNDISGDKRREALERTFFHDVLNTVGGLMGWSSLLQKLEGLDPKEAAGRILILSHRLKQEIEDQRRLSQAERGTLEIQAQPVAVQSILDALKSVFEAHDVAQGKTLEIAPAAEGDRLVTDASLLERVLTNMVKNALEAAQDGQSVRVWFERAPDSATFFVQNPSVIPQEVVPRIFQRSFSTKAAHGRGIGTYSMKLFGERYLRGQVGFETGADRGTVFWIVLPAD